MRSCGGGSVEVGDSQQGRIQLRDRTSRSGRSVAPRQRRRAGRGGKGDPDCRVGLVHVSVRRNPRIGFADRRQVGKLGLSGIACPGVDARVSRTMITPYAVGRPRSGAGVDDFRLAGLSLPGSTTALWHSTTVNQLRARYRRAHAAVILGAVVLISGCGQIPSPPQPDPPAGSVAPSPVAPPSAA